MAKKKNRKDGLEEQPIKLRKQIVPKTINQSKYIQAIEKNTIVFGIGPAGCGKSLLAVNYAIENILAKKYQKLIITRPVIEAGESLGFLPGDIDEKLDPYLRPIYDYIYTIFGDYGEARKWIAEHVYNEPLAYMRGRTYDDSFMLLDEAQNSTHKQIKLFLTRIGENSKAVITADPEQIDLSDGESGLEEARRILIGEPEIEEILFRESDILRSQIVKTVVDAYRKRGVKLN